MIVGVPIPLTWRNVVEQQCRRREHQVVVLDVGSSRPCAELKPAWAGRNSARFLLEHEWEAQFAKQIRTGDGEPAAADRCRSSPRWRPDRAATENVYPSQSRVQQRSPESV